MSKQTVAFPGKGKTVSHHTWRAERKPNSKYAKIAAEQKARRAN